MKFILPQFLIVFLVIVLKIEFIQASEHTFAHSNYHEAEIEAGTFLTIHFSAVDKADQKPVKANFKITNRANGKILSGALDAKRITYLATAEAGEEYLVEVRSDGYKPYSDIFILDPKESGNEYYKVVELEKSKIKVTIKAIDGSTHKTINNAAFTIVNNTFDQTIHTLVNPVTGDCLAELDYSSEYALEAYAKNYIPYYEIYVANENEPHKLIYLYPITSLVPLSITIVENSTKRPLTAEVTIVSAKNDKNIVLVAFKENFITEANLILGLDYVLEVSAPGFKKYQENLSIKNKPVSGILRKTVELANSGTTINIIPFDAVTNKIIDEASVILKNVNNHHIFSTIQNEKNGEYEGEIDAGHPYYISVSAPGYTPKSVNMAADSIKDLALVRIEIPLTPQDLTIELSKIEEEIGKLETFENLEVGKAIVLKHILFDQGKFDLKEDSYEELNKLLKTLEKNPEIKIEIAGHTDNRGDIKLNQMLSRNRAKVIANYLLDHGIKENRLKITGYGSSKPVAPNDTEENRKKNRRVEFIIN
ncbi:hypothetical protein BH23BAC1_BH23BAC1_44750 [soil metagenome]